MPTPDLLIGLAAALCGGLLIGIERERGKGSGPHRRLAGVRTFTLAALAGAGAQSTGHMALVVVGGALIVALAAIGYWRERSRDPGVTTEVALFVTYVIGVIALDRPVLAAGGAVVITVLLAGRGSLHRFSVDVLSPMELRDGLLLCTAALVVLPLLPEQGFAMLPGVNLRRLWGLVLLFAGLQAAGYVAVRVAGPVLGLALSGLASGFVSSTATIAALGARAREAPELREACVSGALFSTVATVALLAVVAATVNAHGLHILAPSLVVGSVASIAVAGLSLRHRRGRMPEAMKRGHAFSLVYAVGFAVSLSAITVAMAYLSAHFGKGAVPVAAAVAGFFDVHASASSVLSVAAAADIPRTQLAAAVLLAFTTNTVSKVVAAFSAGGLAYGARTTAGLLIITAAMWASLLWPGY